MISFLAGYYLAASTSIISVPAAILAIFTLIVLVSGAVVFARASIAKAQIDALRNDRDDLMKRSEIQEGDITRLTAELEGAKQKIEVLEQLVTGKSAVQEVLERLAEHDQRVVRMEAFIRRIDRHTTPPGEGNRGG